MRASSIISTVALLSRTIHAKRSLNHTALIILGMVIVSRAVSVRATEPLGPSGNRNTNNWVYIDNGEVRLGVKTNYGAGIGWFSRSGSNRNLINQWDAGRLVQQSYYGQSDGSLWNEKPWRWNPVQGGDWKGHGAKVLELTVTGNSLYARTLSKHWATGQDLPGVVLEEWISLTNKIAHVHFKMSYHGDVAHPKMSQEIPAFFAQPDLDTLVLYDGHKPWLHDLVSRTIPGWPNEARRMNEHWAAYVGKDDFGIGAYVPAADHLTCYRWGDGNEQHGACSYFAPLIEFAITPGKVFEYDLFITAGKSSEIRDQFYRIHEHEASGAIERATPNHPRR